MWKGLLLALLTTPCWATDFGLKLADAALARTQERITYDGSYYAIDYPGGDVPAHIGVCTDVVIRSYRALGEDLQVAVHEDMKSQFSAYPSQRIWGLTSTDKNIDHRRVPNLRVFFSRHGQSLSIEETPENFLPGDLVTWMLPGNLPHIGIVSDQISELTGNPLVVHNIGSGPKLEDMIFSFTITGHYRYAPKNIKQ